MSGNKKDDNITVSLLDLPWDKEEEHAHRLLLLPDGRLLAYGGVGDGSLLLVDDDNNTSKIIRTWPDDEIKTVAVSTDGRRVAVGLDSGSLHIYAYDDYDILGVHSNTSDTTTPPHPFASPHPTETSFCGPYQPAAIRDLQFQHTQQDNNNNKYWLAVATEAGLSVLDAATADSIVAASPPDLEHGGVRSVLWWSSTLLSSIGMDGRHGVWQLPKNNLELVSSESCITRKDVGEVLGSDVWDRSSRACKAPFNILCLPGEPFLQLRVREDTDDKWHASNMTSTSTAGGHNQAIVLATLHPTNGNVVTSGRDGRVLEWRLTRGPVCVVFACWIHCGQCFILQVSPNTHYLCWHALYHRIIPPAPSSYANFWSSNRRRRICSGKMTSSCTCPAAMASFPS